MLGGMPLARILYIEDEPVLRLVIAEWLEDRGHEVCLADNGLAALHYLSNGYIPDVILLDLNLPVLSGRELMSRLSANHAWRTIPVLIVSADNAADIPPQLYRQVISKPFDLVQISDAIATIVET
jgi:CheY-like chemotaxis protein